MNITLDVAEIARSIELYLVGKKIQEMGKRGESKLVFIKEPLLRNREDVKHLIVAAGSYDPLTIAHVSLFRNGLDAVRRRRQPGLDEILILTSTTHFEKSVNLRENAAIYDRIHAQEGFASCEGNVSLGFFNKALFLDMMKSTKELYKNANIYFLVGSDVMKKVLDPFGYVQFGLNPIEVRDKVLSGSHFIVSQREIDTPDGKKIVTRDDLLDMYPDCRKNSHKMIPLILDADYGRLEIPIESVSSSLIREKRNQREDIRKLVAVGISDFVDKRSLYLRDSDKYSAFVCARQRFADEHVDEPICYYIDKLMHYLHKLDEDPKLREEEVNRKK